MEDILLQVTKCPCPLLITLANLFWYMMVGFFFISIVPIIAFVAMEEIYYSMGRVCRRSKMVDGSGFGSLYCVNYRDAGKSLAWHVLIQGKFISDVVVCNFGGLFEG